MNIVLRRTHLAVQPQRAEPITHSDIQQGLKNGTLKQISDSIYEEVEQAEIVQDKIQSEIQSENQEYKTRDMVAPQKRKRGRPSKNPLLQ